MSGWALDHRRSRESITVDLYVDGDRAASYSANLPRRDLASISPVSQNKGFSFDVRPHTRGRLFSKIDIYFGMSSERVPASRPASRFVNKSYIDLEDLTTVNYSQWMPSPPTEIITFISGQTKSEEEQRHSYLLSGMVNAADVYNVTLDLGLDSIERISHS